MAKFMQCPNCGNCEEGYEVYKCTENNKYWCKKAGSSQTCRTYWSSNSCAYCGGAHCEEYVGPIAAAPIANANDSGDYDCPSCMYRTLRRGASRCPKCQADPGQQYWIDVETKEREAKLRAKEAAERAAIRKAKEETERKAEEAAGRKIKFLEALVFAVAMVFIEYSCVTETSHAPKPTSSNQLHQERSAEQKNRILGVWQGAEYRSLVEIVETPSGVVIHQAWDYDGAGYKDGVEFLGKYADGKVVAIGNEADFYKFEFPTYRLTENGDLIHTCGTCMESGDRFVRSKSPMPKLMYFPPRNDD